MDTLFLELQKLLEIYGEYGSAEERLKKFKKYRKRQNYCAQYTTVIRFIADNMVYYI